LQEYRSGSVYQAKTPNKAGFFAVAPPGSEAPLGAVDPIRDREAEAPAQQKREEKSGTLLQHMPFHGPFTGMRIIGRTQTTGKMPEILFDQ